MFQHENDSFELFCENAEPLPLIGDAITDPLSADIDEDRADLGVEVFLDDPIALLEVLLLAVIIVINNLLEPMHFLRLDDAAVGWRPVEGVVPGVVSGHGHGQEDEENQIFHKQRIMVERDQKWNKQIFKDQLNMYLILAQSSTNFDFNQTTKVSLDFFGINWAKKNAWIIPNYIRA